MRRLWGGTRALRAGAVPFVVVLGACGGTDASPGVAPSAGPEARAVVATLRAATIRGKRADTRPLLRPATALLPLPDGSLGPATPRGAFVRLPGASREPAVLRHAGVEVRVALASAADATAEIVDDVAVYRGAAALASGARGDVVYRITERGFEDHVVLPSAPPGHEVRYRMDVGAASLRLVDGALEVLDAGGAPRVAMRVPFAVDASGVRRAARVSVEGCAVDTSAAPPWGRPTTPPGAAACTLVVTLPADLAYPAVLDPAWSTADAMKDARSFFGLAALASGKVLALGGEDEFAWKASVEMFDPATKTWAQVAPLAQKRSFIKAVRVEDGRVLTCGGSSSDDAGTTVTLAECELFDPTSGQWSAAAPLPAPREQYQMSVLADGRAFFTGGCKQGPGDLNCSLLFKNVGVYTVASDAWKVVPDMSVPRLWHSHSLLQSGKVLVVGGIRDGDNTVDVSEEYDPAAETWAPPVSMLAARALHGAVVMPDGGVLITGGADTGPMKTTELYAGGAWMSGPPMATARSAHRAVLLGNGAVAVLGGASLDGSGNIGPIASAEVLAMGGSSFKPAGNASEPRTSPEVALLPDGRAVMVGGVSDFNPHTTSHAVDVFGDLGAGAGCKVDPDCGSGHCVDGICCDTTCTGACSSCKGADTGKTDGTCAPVLAGQNPKNGCTKDLVNVCGTTGTCDGKGACAFAALATPCLGPTCENGVLKVATCDGKGVCPPAASTACAPFACATGTTCGTTCSGDGDCAAGFKCNGTTCVAGKKPGEPCASEKECESKLCIDGFCCSSACTGQCEACDVAGKEGTCTPVTDVPHGKRAACKGAGKCAGKCDGTTGATCNYPGSLVLCDQACSGSQETLSRCDGDGACKADTPHDCAPYVCGAGGTCKSGCSGDGDCASGYACQGGACAPKSASVCGADGHTLTAPDGTKKDCGAYRCTKEGVCNTTCNTSLDCTEGNTCSSSRTCGPPKAEESEDGGCGCAVPQGRASGPWAMIGVGVGLGALARRRRRAR